METLTIQVPDGAEGKKTKAVLKALGVSFGKEKKAGSKTKEKSYNPEFVAKILKGKKDIEEGRTVKAEPDDIWKYT
jgi:hypothetical protein